MPDRIEALKGLLAQDPNNSRMRYMLATEYVNTGRLAEAVGAYEELIAVDPDYVAGYFQAGRTAEKTGDVSAARSLYQRGIAAAQRVGDEHALGEIQEALSLLG